VLGYNCFMVGATATTGFFFDLVLDDLFGIDLGWETWSAVALVGILVLGRRGVDVSARILGVALVLEVSILLVMDVSVLVQQGWDLGAFAPDLVLGSGVGLVLLFVFTCFLGFEAAALFGEEARDPFRTIPRAIYAALLIMGAFYIVTSLSAVSAFGADEVQAAVTDPAGGGPGAMIFIVAEEYLGSFLTDVLQVLLLVSLFAAYLALHNMATRYLFALGRVRLLPQALGRTSANGAPVVASAAQVVFNTIFVGIFALAGADPLLDIVASMTGFGTLAIVGLQLAAAVSIVVFFRRRKDARLWSTAIAPALAAAGLAAVFVLAIANFGTLAGSESDVIALLPWLIPIVLAIGLGVAHWLSINRPERYAALGAETQEART
jgi:amino acid transporter